MNFCVIIPTYNEASNILSCVNAVKESHHFAVSDYDDLVSPSLRFIVSDGGSNDGTQTIAASLGCEVLGKAPGLGSGRGYQLAYATEYFISGHGASPINENGEQLREQEHEDLGCILLFLHADCLVDELALAALARAFLPEAEVPVATCCFGQVGPAQAKKAKQLFCSGGRQADSACPGCRAIDKNTGISFSGALGCDVATLRLKYNLPAGSWSVRCFFFWCCENWCFRGDGLWRSFGDQGIAITPRALSLVGGFPRWPLFEDVELFRRIRTLAKSSSVRFEGQRICSNPFSSLFSRSCSLNSTPMKGNGHGDGLEILKVPTHQNDCEHVRKVVKVDAFIVSSTRRFDKQGDFIYATKCWLLVLLFALGASPEWLAAHY